jgi:stage IV sporulation protein FB
VRGGYLTLGRWRGAPVRLHWTLPVGALVFGQGRIVPGFWLGFFLLVFIHELGHAFLVRRLRHQVVSIDVHALGGVCRWSGDPTAIDVARIAWGGVLAQAIAYAVARAALALAGPPETIFAAQLVAAFTTTNLWLIAINLIPVPPLDGAEAWKLIGMRRRQRRGGAGEAAGFAYERDAATLARYSDEPPEPVKTAVDDALRRIANDQKNRGN